MEPFAIPAHFSLPCSANLLIAREKIGFVDDEWFKDTFAAFELDPMPELTSDDILYKDFVRAS